MGEEANQTNPNTGLSVIEHGFNIQSRAKLLDLKVRHNQATHSFRLNTVLQISLKKGEWLEPSGFVQTEIILLFPEQIHLSVEIFNKKANVS